MKQRRTANYAKSNLAHLRRYYIVRQLTIAISQENTVKLTAMYATKNFKYTTRLKGEKIDGNVSAEEKLYYTLPEPAAGN